MVGCNVEYGRNARLYGAHCFKLERADFRNGEAALNRRKRKTCIRNFNIADKKCVFVPFLDNFINKRGCCCFSVGSGDCNNLTFVKTIGEFNLAPNRNIFCGNSFHNVGFKRNAGADNTDIKIFKVFFFCFAKDERNFCTDFFAERFCVKIGFAVKNDDVFFEFK